MIAKDKQERANLRMFNANDALRRAQGDIGKVDQGGRSNPCIATILFNENCCPEQSEGFGNSIVRFPGK